MDETMHFYLIRFYNHTDFIAVEVSYSSCGFDTMGWADKVFWGKYECVQMLHIFFSLI